MEKLGKYAIELINEKYKGEFLVYGHTDEPFVKMEKKIYILYLLYTHYFTVSFTCFYADHTLTTTVCLMGSQATYQMSTDCSPTGSQWSSLSGSFQLSPSYRWRGYDADYADL
jgi:hypothetical protein